MIEAGMAWRYKQFSKDAALAQLEVQARQLKRGLWSGQSDKDQIPPWLWRKKARSRKEITLPDGEVMTSKQWNDVETE